MHRRVAFLEELDDRGDVEGVRRPPRHISDEVDDAVPRFVRSGDAIVRAVVVSMVVDRVAVGERRRQDSVEESNVPVEYVPEHDVVVVPASVG